MAVSLDKELKFFFGHFIPTSRHRRNLSKTEDYSKKEEVGRNWKIRVLTRGSYR